MIELINNHDCLHLIQCGQYIFFNVKKVFLPKNLNTIGEQLSLLNNSDCELFVGGYRDQFIQWLPYKRNFGLIKAKSGIVMCPQASVEMLCASVNKFIIFRTSGGIRRREK